jgi:GTP-binding protein Era
MTSRCGFIALLGAPNAGKSTLLNALVGAKVSIVTQKVQTTRSRLRGVTLAGEAQLVLVDTPGIFAPRRRLDRAMVASAWGGAADADIITLLVDAKEGITPDVERIIAGLEEAGRQAVLILNKIDVVRRDSLLALTSRLNDSGRFCATFMISALTGDGVEDLRAWLAAHVPPGPWLYPEDQLSDISERLLAAEVTREKLYLRLHQELPYASTVTTESWRENKDGSLRIDQVIYVERDSQKPIVLGKGGRTIRKIGELARLELEEMLGRRVHLFLRVKVRPNWADDPERYRDIGLDFVD